MRLEYQALSFLSLLIGTAALALDFDTQPHADNLHGWQVDSLTDGQGFPGCSGIMRQDEGFLTVLQTRDGWLLRFPPNRTDYHDGALVSIEGDVIDSQAGFLPKGAGHINISYQAVAWNAQASWLKNAINGDMTTTWRLNRPAAVIGMVEECYQNRGVVPAVKATATTPVVTGTVEYVALHNGADCPAIGGLASGSNGTPAHVTFANVSEVGITLYWLDYTGQPIEYAVLLPGDTFDVDTWANHYWLALDFQGTCHGGLIRPAPGTHVWEIN